MQFITEDDIRVALKEKHELQIADGDSAIYASAEQAALSRMKSALDRANYDVQYIFSRTGTQRDAYLVTLCVDITIYFVMKRLPQRQLPEQRIKAYDEAINYLERLADGKESLIQPKKTVTDELGNTYSQSRIRSGSSKKRNHRY